MVDNARVRVAMEYLFVCLTISWRFPTTFWRFAKILQKLSESDTKVSEQERYTASSF